MCVYICAVYLNLVNPDSLYFENVKGQDELPCVCLHRLENQEEIFLGEKQRAAQTKLPAELGEYDVNKTPS